jgi:hypothetical protein
MIFVISSPTGKRNTRMWTNTQEKNQHVENDEVQMRKINE